MDKAFQLMEALPGFIIVFHFFPRVKIFKGRRDGSQPGLSGIANTGQSTVLEQVGNIPAVSYMDLRMGSVDGGFFIRGILQLHDAERNAVYKKENIGNAAFTPLDHLELINSPEDIFFRMFKIYVMQVKRRQATGRRHVIAILIQPYGIAEAVIVGSSANVAKIGHNGRQVFSRQDVCGDVFRGQKVLKVVFQQGICHFTVQ